MEQEWPPSRIKPVSASLCPPSVSLSHTLNLIFFFFFFYFTWTKRPFSVWGDFCIITTRIHKQLCSPDATAIILPLSLCSTEIEELEPYANVHKATPLKEATKHKSGMCIHNKRHEPTQSESRCMHSIPSMQGYKA